MQHLEKVLHILEDQKFYAKMAMYEFVPVEMLYLGHVIGEDGMCVHQGNIRAILDRPTPKNMTYLHGFLGICAYYKRFVKGFSQLDAPFISITKKGVLEWLDIAQGAFECLKVVMRSCPILALLDFSQPFLLECDTSGEGVGAILMQGSHPIAYEIQKIKYDEILYSIYNKEMLAIMHVLAKFR